MESVELYLKQGLVGKSCHTQTAYRREILTFSAYLKKDPLKATAEELSDFLKKKAKESSPATFSHLLSVLRSFYRFHQRPFPLEKQSYAALTFRPKERLREEDLALLWEDDRRGARGMRDRMMLLMLYHTGMRISELVSLKRSDFCPEEGSVTCGKGTRRRTLPLPPLFCREMTGYQAVWALKQEKEAPFLFGKEDGTPLSRQGFWKTVREMAFRAGIAEKVNPQSLREAFARRSLASGCSAEEVKRLLGNASNYHGEY